MTARPQPLLRLLPGALLRTPALPSALACELFGAPDALAALHAMLRARPELIDIIRTASSSLASALQAWSAAELDRRLRVGRVGLAYALRSATRATPLGACATVSPVCETRADGAVAIDERVTLRVRPDYRWLSAVLDELALRPEILERARVFDSGQARESAGKLWIADFSQAYVGESEPGRRPNPLPQVRSMRTTSAVRAVRAALDEGPTVGELAERLRAQLGVTHEQACEFIAELVRVGLLVSELRIGPLGETAHEALAVLERVSPDDATALRGLVEELGRLVALDESFARRYGEAEERAAALAGQEHYLQVDALRPAPVSVPASWLDAIAGAGEMLARIAVPSPLPAALAAAFAHQYNTNREVPLLDVLDEFEGFAFDAVVRESQGAGATARDRLLMRWALDAFATGTRALELDEETCAALAAELPERAYADGYEAICQVGTAADGGFAIACAFHQGAYRSLGRFLEYFPELRQRVDAGRTASGDGLGSVTAEVVSIPWSRRAGNVATRPRVASYTIPCATAPGADGAVIPLDDLLVRSDGTRISLRSKRLGADVRVVRAHAVNPNAASRVDVFLDLVQPQSVQYLAFAWGPLASELPYRPRVSVGRAIVSPESWRVPVDAARDRGALLAWRELWRVPDRFVLADNDHRLVLDWRDEVFVDMVIETAQKSALEALTFEEYPFQLGAEDVADSLGRTYCAELAVSFATAEDRMPGPAPHPPAAAAGAVKTPGSEWVSLELSMGRARQDVFLAEHASALIAAAGECDLLHFLRYADPRPHLRMRFRSAEESPAMLQSIVATLRNFVARGLVTKFALTTYDREIERYGGGACIDHAERIFHFDSIAVLGRPAQAAAPSESTAVLAAAALFVTDLTGDCERATSWLKRSLARRKKLTAAEWTRIKGAYEIFQRELAHPDAARAGLGEAAAALRAAAEPSSLDGIVGALVHMHCNRVGIDPSDELNLLACILPVFEQHLYRNAARRTTDDGRGSREHLGPRDPAPHRSHRP